MISILIIIALAISAAVGGAFLNATPDSTESAAGRREINIYAGRDGISPEMAAPISEYFKQTFMATANLQTTDITSLFSEPASANAGLNQSALDYLIQLRLKQSTDLKMTNYQCDLVITAISQDGEAVDVDLLENATVNFAFTTDVDSSTSGIRHHFRLIKKDQAYAIAEHIQDEDRFNLLQEAIAAQPDQAKTVMAEILSKATANVEALALEKRALNSGELTANRVFSGNPYDPEAAVKYAMTWVDPQKTLRNTQQFDIYDEVGGNCNNYISQAINAGGIPMDIIGDEFTQWKWYSDDVNIEETAYGRSPAWAGVEEFYLYARENTGYGLSAAVDENVYSGAVGDVLQFGYGDEWLHSVLITAVIKDKDGNVVDYLVNSNTTDRINYPASAYGYPQQRLIKILGWNGDSMLQSE